VGALVVLAAEAGVVAPGSTGTCVVLVRNLAEEHDDFDVLVHGPGAVWATIEPASLSIPPGEEATAWVHLAVPRDPSVRPGPVEFAVTVSSRNDPSFIHAERASVEVGAFTALRSALEALEDEGRTVRVPVRLDNGGNAAVAAQVSLRDDPSSARQVTVPPMGSVELAFDVRRRRGLEQVVVEVAPDGQDPVSLAAPLPDERSTLRRDLTRSATVLGVLLVAAFIAVATLGGADDDSETQAAVSLGPGSSTTAAPSPEDDGRPVGPVAATDQPAVAASTGGGPAPATTARTPGPAAPLPPLVFVRAYGPGDRDLVVRSADGSELRLRSGGTIESSPVLSPDRSLVAYVQERGGKWQACLVPATGGESRCLFAVGSTSSLAWKADGSTLYATRGSDLMEIALDPTYTYAFEPTFLPVTVPGGRFALSPDGSRVAVIDGGRIVIRPLAGGEGLALRVPGNPEDPAWTPDGEQIVYTADTHVHVAPLGDGPVRQLTAPQTVNGDPVVVDGWVVFRSNRTGNGDLYAIRLDGADKAEVGLAQITRTPERDTDPSR
jgi:hypothetical protein